MNAKRTTARVTIAGTGGDSGKTLISMGLAALWKKQDYKVTAFKKGPDYIDAAWLEFASGNRVRNLDTYMMRAEGVLRSFRRHCRQTDICLIEGNRGLYDGMDNRGTHSTAELAKLLQTPVVLILNVTKVTRTAAATVLGCQLFDKDLNIAGVILNRTAGSRHEEVIRTSIEQTCGIPVIGAVPKIQNGGFLPDRHLGLVTPQEHPETEGLNDRLSQIIEKFIDADRIREIAEQAPTFNSAKTDAVKSAPMRPRVRIAFFQDSAFTFYYPDNLEALEMAGAELVPVSSLGDATLPDCEGLYIGGGFPETHARELSQNRSLLHSVRQKADDGLPIFAECGGLIFLCRSISFQDETFPLAGVFPLDLEMRQRPQGHGYMEVEVDRENPFFPQGIRIRGHEFHYSRIIDQQVPISSIYSVKRGTGSFHRRDGLLYRHVLASYLHIHAEGTPTWAPDFIKTAKAYQQNRK